MKRLTQILLASCFYILLAMPVNSFAASVNHATIAESPVLKEKKHEKLIKKIEKKTKKWFKKSDKIVDDTGDDISGWTWASIGLIVLALLFPPFAIFSLITSAVALRKNKNNENFGDLDRTLALTTLILSIIGVVALVLLFGIIGLSFLLAV